MPRLPGIHARRVSPSLEGLDDFYNEQYQYTARPEGIADTPGRIAAPALPNVNSDEGEWWLKMRRFIEELWHEKRTQLISEEPREMLVFKASLGEVAIPAASSATIASFQVPDKHGGALKFVQMEVFNPASYPSITWALTKSGLTYPFFNNYVATPSTNTLGRDGPILELVAGKTYSLVATNSAALPVTVAGSIEGWVAYLASWKDYGITPANGL